MTRTAEVACAPGSDHAVGDAPGRRRGARGHVELGADVRDMPVDGVDAEHQPVGDLSVGSAAGDEGEHLLLTLGEGARDRGRGHPAPRGRAAHV